MLPEKERSQHYAYRYETDEALGDRSARPQSLEPKKVEDVAVMS